MVAMLHELLLLFWLVLTAKCTGERKAIQCLSEYEKALKSFDGPYLSAVKSQLKALKHGSELKTKANLNTWVIDVGLGSRLNSQIFHHMMQLNISGVDFNGKSTSNCKINTDLKASDKLKSSIFRVRQPYYVHHKNLPFLIDSPAWIDLVDRYPDTIVLMSDLSDEQWYENRQIEACSDDRKGRSPVHCYLPMVPLRSFNFNEHSAVELRNMLLARLSFDQVKPALQAYRDLITCMVPTDKLFTFNLRNTSSSAYWSGLTSVLRLNYSSPNTGSDGSTPVVSLLDHLIAGGLAASPKQRQVCLPLISTDASGVTHIDSTAAACAAATAVEGVTGDSVEVSPSVCDDPPRDLLPAPTADRLTQCAIQYADSMAQILGNRSEYRGLLLDQMLYSSPNTLRRAPQDSRRLILNVAPGTTGTTSLFFATTLLNITGRHYAQYRVNCTIVQARGGLIDSDMKILAIPQFNGKKSSSSNEDVNDNHGVVFWADTPVSEMWWHLYRMYPHSRIIMTDVRNVSAWISKRHKEHCRTFSSSNAWSCTVPIPVDLGHAVQSKRYNESLIRELLETIHVSRVQSELGVKVYEAYRQLIRCSVPEEQQHWIYFSEQKDPAVFWNNLIDFTGISMTRTARNSLIDAGVPRESTGKCMMGNRKCSYIHGVVVPSVCSGIVSDKEFLGLN